MKRKVEISSGAFDKPFVTEAIYETSMSFLVLKWRQTHDGDDRPSYYELRLDKTTGVAQVQRSGEYQSLLVFDTGKKTSGTVTTPFGEINTDIRTRYITVPSVLCPKLEIAYVMGADEIENIFSVKFV